MSQNWIQKIIDGDNITNIINAIKADIYRDGAIQSYNLEALSLLKLYQPQVFAQNESEILSFMALYFKNIEPQSIKQLVFSMYGSEIKNRYSLNLTPVQANIKKNIINNQVFSFSAPTSTGKSFVFLDIIRSSLKDVVIIVPSRALINEYVIKLSESIKDKTINILPFVDCINKDKCKRSVFVVTPERCRQLFTNVNDYNVEFFLFDEAQLGDENNKRALWYDGIIRRCQKHYPHSKFIFSHPFISNPEAQIKKNNFNLKVACSTSYNQRNVGQMFYIHNSKDKFYHFGLDKEIMGDVKIDCKFDPIEKVLRQGGSVLIYASKSAIVSGKKIQEYKKYIDLCPKIEGNELLDNVIENLKMYTGGTITENFYFSDFISMLRRGIFIHHGSLPLYTRIQVEKLTNAGLCKICFATSTLEQGVNMPFDLVYLSRLEASNILGVKNLIGRAGRSTSDLHFDVGSVVLGKSSMLTKFRKLMTEDITISEQSLLDDEKEFPDYEDFKKSINDGSFIDEFNMTPNEIKVLEQENIISCVSELCNSLVDNQSNIVNFKQLRTGEFLKIRNFLISIYQATLGRELCRQERSILMTAIYIMFLRIIGRTFNTICKFRYDKIAKVRERKLCIKNGGEDNIKPEYAIGFAEIPNKNLKPYPMFKKGVLASQVRYDSIMYDTYDYIDKLIDLKLSDIYYAAFLKYYDKLHDHRSLILAKIVRYGTNDEKEIMLLRYGLSFEEIDVIKDYVVSIDENRIVFANNLYELSDDKKKCIERYL